MSREPMQDVLVSIRQIIHATDLQSRRVMKQSGLTIPQVMVLKAIADLGEVTARRLSERVSVSQATVTTILNRLEQRGLVVRVRSTTDKRVVHAELTEAGREALEKAPPLLHENFVRQFEELEPWEQNQILSSLQRVSTMMGAGDYDAAPMLTPGENLAEEGSSGS